MFFVVVKRWKRMIDGWYFIFFYVILWFKKDDLVLYYENEVYEWYVVD